MRGVGGRESSGLRSRQSDLCMGDRRAPNVCEQQQALPRRRAARAISMRRAEFAEVKKLGEFALAAS